MKARKLPTTKKRVATKQHRIRSGTRNQLGSVASYDSAQAVIKEARKRVREFIPWAERYNLEAVEKLQSFAEDMGSYPGTGRRRYELMFDEHTGMHIVIEIWHADAENNQGGT
jgi:hypothetical protein